MSQHMTKSTPIVPPTASFPHAMLREIYEQPQALAETIERYVPGGASTAETLQPVVDAIGRRERLVIAASGSSRHAGLAGEIMLEDLAGIPVDVEYASEYTYRSTHTLHNPGVIVISQSGETADTLAALREARPADSLPSRSPITLTPAWQRRRTRRCQPLPVSRRPFRRPRALRHNWPCSTRLPSTWLASAVA